jgi:DNA-binding transcriptional ArsR family regulator
LASLPVSSEAPATQELAESLASLLDDKERPQYFTEKLINRLVQYPMVTADPLSATFAALADPTRRAILSRLARGETSVTELARPFKISLPAVTKHLKVLQRAGLITQSRQAQWRPCKLEPKPLQDVSVWVEQYRQFWEASFDRLENYLRELQAREAAKEQEPPA